MRKLKEGMSKETAVFDLLITLNEVIEDNKTRYTIGHHNIDVLIKSIRFDLSMANQLLEDITNN